MIDVQTVDAASTITLTEAWVAPEWAAGFS
jgi:hypothetical protein